MLGEVDAEEVRVLLVLLQFRSEMLVTLLVQRDLHSFRRRGRAIQQELHEKGLAFSCGKSDLRFDQDGGGVLDQAVDMGEQPALGTVEADEYRGFFRTCLVRVAQGGHLAGHVTAVELLPGDFAVLLAADPDVSGQVGPLLVDAFGRDLLDPRTQGHGGIIQHEHVLEILPEDDLVGAGRLVWFFFRLFFRGFLLVVLFLFLFFRLRFGCGLPQDGLVEVLRPPFPVHDKGGARRRQPQDGQGDEEPGEVAFLVIGDDIAFFLDVVRSFEAVPVAPGDLQVGLVFAIVIAVEVVSAEFVVIPDACPDIDHQLPAAVRTEAGIRGIKELQLGRGRGPVHLQDASRFGRSVDERGEPEGVGFPHIADGLHGRIPSGRGEDDFVMERVALVVRVQSRGGVEVVINGKFTFLPEFDPLGRGRPALVDQEVVRRTD